MCPLVNGDRNTAFVNIGGDASGATTAFRDVQTGMRATQQEAAKTGQGIQRSFTRASKGVSVFKKAMDGLGKSFNVVIGLAKRLSSFAFRQLRRGVLGITAAVVASTIAWNKEAAAQSRINAILRANTRDFGRSRRELDSLIRRTQRLTNFGDRDVEALFAATIGQLGNQGFGAGRRLLPATLDVSAALGLDPRLVAETIVRNIAAGTVGETFRKFGIRTGVEDFRRQTVGQRVETAAREIGAFAPGAAGQERRANPTRALIGNFVDVMEQAGRIFAVVLNPAMEKAARFFQDLANTLQKQSPAQAFESLKDEGLEFFEFMGKLAKGTWFFIADQFKVVTNSIRNSLADMILDIGRFLRQSFSRGPGQASGAGGGVGGASFSSGAFAFGLAGLNRLSSAGAGALALGGGIGKSILNNAFGGRGPVGLGLGAAGGIGNLLFPGTVSAKTPTNLGPTGISQSVLQQMVGAGGSFLGGLFGGGNQNIFQSAAAGLRAPPFTGLTFAQAQAKAGVDVNAIFGSGGGAATGAGAGGGGKNRRFGIGGQPGPTRAERLQNVFRDIIVNPGLFDAGGFTTSELQQEAGIPTVLGAQGTFGSGLVADAITRRGGRDQDVIEFQEQQRAHKIQEQGRIDELRRIRQDDIRANWRRQTALVTM